MGSQFWKIEFGEYTWYGYLCLANIVIEIHRLICKNFLFFFGFQHLLRKASLAEDDAFAFLKGDNQGDFITFSALHEALCQVLDFINFAMWDVNFSYKINSLWSNVIQFKLIGHPYGLSSQEMKKLWAQADINGDGVIDYEEFKVSSSPKLLNMT